MTQDGDEKLTKWLDPTINVMYAFSATLGNGVRLVNCETVGYPSKNRIRIWEYLLLICLTTGIPRFEFEFCWDRSSLQVSIYILLAGVSC